MDNKKFKVYRDINACKLKIVTLLGFFDDDLDIFAETCEICEGLTKVDSSTLMEYELQKDNLYRYGKALEKVAKDIQFYTKHYVK